MNKNNVLEVINHMADNYLNDMEEKLDMIFSEESVQFTVNNEVISIYSYGENSIKLLNKQLFMIYFEEYYHKSSKDLESKSLYLKLVKELI